jgi:hypothetical protein
MIISRGQPESSAQKLGLAPKCWNTLGKSGQKQHQGKAEDGPDGQHGRHKPQDGKQPGPIKDRV